MGSLEAQIVSSVLRVRGTGDQGGRRWRRRPREDREGRREGNVVLQRGSCGSFLGREERG